MAPHRGQVRIIDMETEITSGCLCLLFSNLTQISSSVNEQCEHNLLFQIIWSSEICMMLIITNLL